MWGVVLVGGGGGGYMLVVFDGVSNCLRGCLMVCGCRFKIRDSRFGFLRDSGAASRSCVMLVVCMAQWMNLTRLYGM